MTYKEIVGEFAENGIEHIDEITQTDWIKLARAYMDEHPTDALEGLFHAIDEHSAYYGQILDIMEGLRPDDATSFARIGLLLVHSVQHEIRSDVAAKLDEYWAEYRESRYAHA